MPLIDPVRLQSSLGRYAGRFDVEALEACDSTSSELMRRADRGAPSGTVIVADCQSAGRGRRGRQWLSTPADSLTFSMLWRFSGSNAQLAGLSLAIGVAVSEALEGLGATKVRLKWPNDVLLVRGGESAKLAGILIELGSDRRGTQAVIGVGINLHRPEGETAQPAAGLIDALPALPGRHELLAALLVALLEVLERFESGGFAVLQLAWQQRNAWQSQTVRLMHDDVVEGEGICLGADTDGALLVETVTGIKRFVSGDLSLRPARSALGVRPA